MTNSMSQAQRLTAARTIGRLDAGGRVAHKKKKTSYASGCNRQYIREQGRKRGVVGVDLDMNPNKQLNPWLHHQLFPTKRDAWFDIKHQIGDRDSCRELTDAQMARFRVRYKGKNRPMLTALQGAQTCLIHGVIPCVEAKGIHQCYLDPQWWFDNFVNGWDSRLQPVIMRLPGTRGGQTGLSILAAAHEVGLPTVWLWRPAQVPITTTAAFRQHVDLVKSRPGRGIYRV